MSAPIFIQFIIQGHRFAGEPLLPWVLVPQLDDQREEARVCVVQVKPGNVTTYLNMEATFAKIPPKGLLYHHGRCGGGGDEDGGEVHHGGAMLLLLMVCW